MTNSETEDWHAVLPKEIIHRAFACDCELAWLRADALEVVNTLQS